MKITKKRLYKRLLVDFARNQCPIGECSACAARAAGEPSDCVTCWRKHVHKFLKAIKQGCLAQAAGLTAPVRPVKARVASLAPTVD